MKKTKMTFNNKIFTTPFNKCWTSGSETACDSSSQYVHHLS